MEEPPHSDLSLVGMPTANSPKLKAVASAMLEVYERVQRDLVSLPGSFKALQIGFCDLGTPNDESEQVYGKLRGLLIEGGIPASGIRYVHDAKTDAAKASLFQQCRSGEVAILLGSTALMGTGTNIQNRCAAIHHIDAPWRPDEVEQREGRGHRPGNQYPVIDIYRYVQHRTFDAYSWQTLTTKAVFFDQMRRGKITGREMDELGETALSYAQVKAAATGDPLVLEQAELDVTIAQLQRLQFAHIRARKRDAQEAARARYSGDRAVARAEALQMLAENVARCSRPGFSTPSGEHLTEKPAIGAAITRQVQRLLYEKGGKEWVGFWSGERVSVHVEEWGKTYAVSLLIGNDILRVEAPQSWMAKKQQWRFADALDQAVGTASYKIEREEVSAAKARMQAEQLERQVLQPFLRAEELKARLARKAALDEYTSIVAAVKEDPNGQDELAAKRAQLLKDVPDFSFLSDAIQPMMRASGTAVPLFGESWSGRTKTLRRPRSRRKNDGSEMDEQQLSLFPELVEREV